MILNMVDANNPDVFSKDMIDQALDFIDGPLDTGLKVLVHCDQGKSRSPSIAFLYIASRPNALLSRSIDAAESEFRQIYPEYNPDPGIREHMRLNWESYRNHIGR